MKFPALVSAIKSCDSNGIKFDWSTSLSKIYFIQNVNIFADYKDHYFEPVCHRWSWCTHVLFREDCTLFMAGGRGGRGKFFKFRVGVSMCFKYISEFFWIFWGDNFWNNVVSTFPLVLPLCTDVLNFISSTGTEEPGSAVSLFTDPFSFQRLSNARLKNIKTAGDLWPID